MLLERKSVSCLSGKKNTSLAGRMLLASRWKLLMHWDEQTIIMVLDIWYYLYCADVLIFVLTRPSSAWPLAPCGSHNIVSTAYYVLFVKSHLSIVALLLSAPMVHRYRPYMSHCLMLLVFLLATTCVVKIPALHGSTSDDHMNCKASCYPSSSAAHKSQYKTRQKWTLC